MNKEHIIRRQIEQYGNTVMLYDDEWNSMPYKAMISPLWRKKSSNFEKVFTEIGSDINEYFLYIGPANHDITVLSDNAIIKADTKSYEFKHKDKTIVGDEVLYFVGILRLLKGADIDED